MLRDRGFFGLAVALRSVENAGDGRQGMVGRVALSHDSSLRIEFGLRNRCPTSARCTFLSADTAALCQILAFLRRRLCTNWR